MKVKMPVPREKISSIKIMTGNVTIAGPQEIVKVPEIAVAKDKAVGTAMVKDKAAEPVVEKAIKIVTDVQTRAQIPLAINLRNR